MRVSHISLTSSFVFKNICFAPLVLRMYTGDLKEVKMFSIKGSPLVLMWSIDWEG